MSRLARLAHPKAPDDYEARLKALQLRLYALQTACRRGGRSGLILIEGWDAAGKGGLIKRLTAELDPRFFEVVPIAAPSPQEKAEHWLQRFWRWLPATGEWTIFDRTWYGRVLVERVEGFAAEDAWRRAYGEIVETERMLAEAGVVIIKLFLHISQKEQDARFRERLMDPWKRWKMGTEDFRNRRKRAAYEVAIEDMLEATDTAFAPWHLVGANSKAHARIAGLAHIAERLSEGLDLSPPPLAPELRALAEAELGLTELP
ncbi:polyphosphate kinase 2 family protein [Thermaurantiacus sp.]